MEVVVGGLSLIVYLSNNGNLHSVQLSHGCECRGTLMGGCIRWQLKAATAHQWCVCVHW